MVYLLFIAIAYILIGTIGITLNLLASILMATDKEMRQGTYAYMIQLCVCDIIALFGLAFYTGFALIFPILQTDIALALVSYFLAIGSFSGSCFMVLVSASRCVQLVWAHKSSVIFSKRVIAISVVSSYLVVAIAFSYNIFYRPLLFYLITTSGKWTFNMDTPVGHGAATRNLGYCSMCACLITVFNVISLYGVRKMRRQIQSVETRENRKREVKLFLQCAITGNFCILSVILFFMMTFWELTSVASSVVMHVVWVILHVQNPMVYFVINTRLRERLMSLFWWCWN